MKKTLLFYGPLVHHWWFKNIILPHLYSLSENGWKVVCYFSNKFQIVDVINNDYLPLNALNKINFVLEDREFPIDINRRYYTSEDGLMMKGFLLGKLADVNPDVILLRGPNASYLNSIFPGTPILNIMEGAFPFMEYSNLDFVLFPGDKFWGVPFYDEHRTILEKRHKPSSEDSHCLNKFRQAVTRRLQNPFLDDYIAKLRRRFSKIILFPLGGYTLETQFIAKYHTFYGDEAENLKKLVMNSPSDWCFLATFHPLYVQTEAYNGLHIDVSTWFNKIRQQFIDCDNVFFSQIELFSRFVTHPLVYYSDATAIQNGKTMYLSLLLNKPVISAGEFCLDFYGIIDGRGDVASGLDEFVPPSETIMNTFFYWLITRFKHPHPKMNGTHFYFKNVLERAVDKNVAASDLYEWASEDIYRYNFDSIINPVMTGER